MSESRYLYFIFIFILLSGLGSTQNSDAAPLDTSGMPFDTTVHGPHPPGTNTQQLNECQGGAPVFEDLAAIRRSRPEYQERVARLQAQALRHVRTVQPCIAIPQALSPPQQKIMYLIGGAWSRAQGSTVTNTIPKETQEAVHPTQLEVNQQAHQDLRKSLQALGPAQPPAYTGGDAPSQECILASQKTAPAARSRTPNYLKCDHKPNQPNRPLKPTSARRLCRSKKNVETIHAAFHHVADCLKINKNEKKLLFMLFNHESHFMNAQSHTGAACFGQLTSTALKDVQSHRKTFSHGQLDVKKKLSQGNTYDLLPPYGFQSFDERFRNNPEQCQHVKSYITNDAAEGKAVQPLLRQAGKENPYDDPANKCRMVSNPYNCLLYSMQYFQILQHMAKRKMALITYRKMLEEKFKGGHYRKDEEEALFEALRSPRKMSLQLGNLLKPRLAPDDPDIDDKKLKAQKLKDKIFKRSNELILKSVFGNTTVMSQDELANLLALWSYNSGTRPVANLKHLVEMSLNNEKPVIEQFPDYRDCMEKGDTDCTEKHLNATSFINGYAKWLKKNNRNNQSDEHIQFASQVLYNFEARVGEAARNEANKAWFSPDKLAMCTSSLSRQVNVDDLTSARKH